MISVETIFETVNRAVRFERGRFFITGKVDEIPTGTTSVIPPDDFLIPLIKNIDKRWSFDIEPTPRTVGNLIELLRGCRFLRESGDSGEISILPDVSRARNLGAFDTPDPIVKFIVETVLSHLPDSKKTPLILDPACGAGYFLLETLDRLVERFPDISPETIACECLAGFDIDKVAIALSEQNLRWHFENKYSLKPAKSTVEKILKCVDALSEFENLPFGIGNVDCVIGNPPYQFYSGKGSPVASLKKAGKNDEARKLEIELAGLAKRFPATSKGCRDRYKWFINRAVEFLKPGGILGFITPNTWMQYPRYRDVRTLLAGEGNIKAIIDLGSLAFRRAHVPASIIIWEKSLLAKNNSFPVSRISADLWQRTVDGDNKALSGSLENARKFEITESWDFRELRKRRIAKGDQFDLIEFLIDAPPAPHRVSLGEIAVLREGSHAIRAVRRDISRERTNDADYPVLIDKIMGDLIPPEPGFIRLPDPEPSNTEFHSGQRFLIRKTGDRLLVAPSPTDDFALAHQNVYVGKLKTSSIPFLALVGILSSKLITDLYRKGPGGQYRRPLAQFRIAFLKHLPIIVSPPEYTADIEPQKQEIEKLLSQCKSDDIAKIEPIPRDFPSDSSKAQETACKIAACHGAIEKLTADQIMRPDKKTKHMLDILVYYLYGGYKKHE